MQKTKHGLFFVFIAIAAVLIALLSTLPPASERFEEQPQLAPLNDGWYYIQLKSRRGNCASLYQWLTTSETGEDGVTTTVPVKFADEEALDEKIESMLNDEGYAKSDFIVMKYIEYRIDAADYDIE